MFKRNANIKFFAQSDCTANIVCPVCVNFNRYLFFEYNEKDEAPVTRMGTMALIRELLIKSRDYMNQLDAYNENSEEHDKPEFDIKLDAMIPVLKKQIPVKIHAHRADSNLVGKSVNTAISASLPTSSVPTLSSIQQFFAAVEVIAFSAFSSSIPFLTAITAQSDRFSIVISG